MAMAWPRARSVASDAGLKLGHGQPRPPSIDQGVATKDEGTSTVMLRHLYKTQPVAEPSDWCEALQAVAGAVVVMSVGISMAPPWVRWSLAVQRAGDMAGQYGSGNTMTGLLRPPCTYWQV